MLLVGSPIAIATSRGAYADAVIAAGPVAYWRLGETSGTTAADSSGNGRAGTYIGGVTLGQAGALSDGNKAASFDGVDDVVDVTNAAVRLAGELTVEAWINPAIVNTGSDSTIARCGIGSDLMWWLALRADGALQSGHYDGAAFQIVATAGGVITTGQWRHVVVTRAADGKTYKFYVDGALVSSSATTTTPVAAGAQTTQIGKSATQQFNGALDEVAIYARALTAAEIADHYALRTSPVVAGGTAQITTSVAHGLRTNDHIYITGHLGDSPDLDGERVMTAIDATTLSVPVILTHGGSGGTLQLIATGADLTIADALLTTCTVSDAVLTDVTASDARLVTV